MSKKKLSKDDILHLAKLSSLTLSDKEEKDIESKFDETLNYIENLNELNTDKIIPTNSVVETKNIGFEDPTLLEELRGASGRRLTQEEALKNSKSKKGKFFAVKRIL